MAEQTFLDRVRNTIRRNEGQPSTRNAAQWFRTKLRGLRGQLRNHGFAYAGPRMANLRSPFTRYAHNNGILLEGHTETGNSNVKLASGEGATIIVSSSNCA